MSNQRNGLIAKIHIAKKDSGNDEAVYREMLQRVTGKASTKGMSIQELDAVLAEYKARGWKPSPPRGAGGRAMANGAQAKMIRAMWLDLRDAGQLTDPSEKALASYCKRMTGVSDLKFLNPAKADILINALRGWLKRVNG